MSEPTARAAAFSPAIGGVACYVLIKKETGITVIKAHENPKYSEYIGDFKKPGIGMFVVMKDLIADEFNLEITNKNAVMIGDTWHDKEAATKFGIDFIEASNIHQT